MAAMLKGMSSLKRTLLFGSLAAGSFAITGLLYWKFYQKREKQKESKPEAGETLVKSKPAAQQSISERGDEASGSEKTLTADICPDLIPFAKKVVDEAVERGVEQYHNEHCGSGGVPGGEKDTLELMEKERTDSTTEVASSSGSSGQSDISFEKIGDFDQLQSLGLQESVVTEPSSGGLHGIIPTEPESLPSDFSIISESRAAESLQTSGGFSLIQDDSSLVRNDSPDVIVVSSDSEEQTKPTEVDVATTTSSEPDVIPNPPVLVEKEDDDSGSIQDVSTSFIDVTKQTELDEPSSLHQNQNEDIGAQSVKVEVKKKKVPTATLR